MIRLWKERRRIYAETKGFTLLEILIGMSLLALVFLMLSTFSLMTVRSQVARTRWEQAEALIEAEIEHCRALAARGYFTEIAGHESISGIYKISMTVDDFTLDSYNRLVPIDSRSVRLKQVTITVTVPDQPGFTPVTRSTLIMVR